eukprot:s599_g5.t1
MWGQGKRVASRGRGKSQEKADKEKQVVQHEEQSIDQQQTQPTHDEWLNTLDTYPYFADGSPVHSMQALSPAANPSQLLRGCSTSDLEGKMIPATQEIPEGCELVEEEEEEEILTEDEEVHVYQDNETVQILSEEECVLSPPKELGDVPTGENHDEKKTCGKNDVPKPEPESVQEPLESQNMKQSADAPHVPEETPKTSCVAKPNTVPESNESVLDAEGQQEIHSEEETVKERESKGTFKAQLALRQMAKEREAECDDPDRAFAEEGDGEEEPGRKGRGKGKGRGRGRGRGKGKERKGGKAGTLPESVPGAASADAAGGEDVESKDNTEPDDVAEKPPKCPKIEKAPEKTTRKRAPAKPLNEKRENEPKKAKTDVAEEQKTEDAPQAPSYARLENFKIFKVEVAEKDSMVTLPSDDVFYHASSLRPSRRLVQSRGVGAAFYVPGVNSAVLSSANAQRGVSLGWKKYGGAAEAWKIAKMVAAWSPAARATDDV